MTTIYVTGAGGFIGSRLVQELESAGMPWIPLGRKANGREWAVSKIIPGSICIHLAGQNDLKLASENAERTVCEAKELAAGLVGMNFARLVFASSAVVYGDKSLTPFTEKDAVSAAHPYAMAKLEAEKIFLRSGYTVARLANVYGSRMAKGNVISDILGQIYENHGAVYIRDGSSIRDFIHVEDVVRGLIELAKTNNSGIYNFGTGIGTKIYDLAQLILCLAEQQNRQIISLKKEDSKSCNIIDSSKSLLDIGWSAKKSLKEGMINLLSNI